MVDKKHLIYLCRANKIMRPTWQASHLNHHVCSQSQSYGMCEFMTAKTRLVCDNHAYGMVAFSMSEISESDGIDRTDPNADRYSVQNQQSQRIPTARNGENCSKRPSQARTVQYCTQQQLKTEKNSS